MLESEVIFEKIESASLFELYHLSKLIEEAMKSPERITAVGHQLKIGDVVEWFNDRSNECYSGCVLEKHQTYVILEDIDNNPTYCHKVPYCQLNVGTGEGSK